MTPASAGAGPFAERARRRAGEAALLLGWRPDEFWRATPAELGAVAEAMRPEPAAAVDVDALKRMFPDG